MDRLSAPACDGGGISPQYQFKLYRLIAVLRQPVDLLLAGVEHSGEPVSISPAGFSGQHPGRARLQLLGTCADRSWWQAQHLKPLFHPLLQSGSTAAVGYQQAQLGCCNETPGSATRQLSEGLFTHLRVLTHDC